MATQTQLTEAETAYHKLLTGRAVVSVSIDGVATQYTQADKSSLKSYIDTLKIELGITTSTRSRPAGVY